MICIKVQLACAASMLATNVIYIFIFIFVAVKTRNESNQVGMVQYGTTLLQIGAQPAFYQP